MFLEKGGGMTTTAVQPSQQSYGMLWPGSNNIVFVVPHGADPHEAIASSFISRLALATNSQAIINTQIQRQHCDLNNVVSVSRSNDHRVQAYFKDLVALVKYVTGSYAFGFILFIHATPRTYKRQRYLFVRNEKGQLLKKKRGDQRDWDVDIGCGLAEWAGSREWLKQKQAELLRFLYPRANVVKPSVPRGYISCERIIAHQLRRFFQWRHLNTFVGREWPAVKQTNMVQELAMRFPRAQVLQIEIIDHLFREERIFEALEETTSFLRNFARPR
jgi:hypothetical protein